MNRQLGQLSVLAVFLIGFICGAAALHLYRLREENRIFRSRDVLAEVLIYKLDQQLELSSEQENQIRAIVLEARGQVLEISRDIVPRIFDIFDRSQSKIRTTLTSQQQKTFDEIVAERRKLMKQIHHGQQK